MSKSIEEEKVSKFYHSIEPDEESIIPPARVDSFILKAAAGQAKKQRKRNSYLIPLSAAASVVIIITATFQLTVMTNQTKTDYSELSVKKQPMYMLQRSKPASADEMILKMIELLDTGDVDQARLLFKKIKTHYPDYELSPDIMNRLK